MSPNRETSAPEGLELEGGRLVSHPGRDLYFYTFELPGDHSLTIGRRGQFICGQKILHARVTDINGSHLTVNLNTNQHPGETLDGLFRPSPSPTALNPNQASKEAPALDGLELFLNHTEGWLMRATEAAGDKKTRSNQHNWPLVPREELPANLSAVGPTFLWSQRPDFSTDTALGLLRFFLSKNWHCLVLGDNPRILEPLAQLPQTAYLAPAPEKSPLGLKSIYALAQAATLRKEQELNQKREELRLLQRLFISYKATMEQWKDLDDLETRFAELGREVERFSPDWNQVRQKAESAHILWEEAKISLDKNCSGLLGFFRKKQDQPKVDLEKTRRLELDEAERALVTVRAEENKCLEEARRLESRLYQSRQESSDWRPRPELQRDMDELQKQQEALATNVASLLARPEPKPQDYTKSEVMLALLGDVTEEGPAILGGSEFEVILILSSFPPDHLRRQNLAAMAGWATRHFIVLGDFTFWPVWDGDSIPRTRDGGPVAWSNFLVAEETDASKNFVAADGLFNPQQPLPKQGPALARLELNPSLSDFAKGYTSALGAGAASGDVKPGICDQSTGHTQSKSESQSQGLPVGLGLRALGELGPANPVSALITAKAALNFALQRETSSPAVIIITPSEAQSRLISLILQDLKAPPHLIFTGQPNHFHHWSAVPLVILDTAFESPHRGHPWAWPAYGRSRLTWAWRLAGEQLWLSGRQDWLGQLPSESPLATLWGKALQVILPVSNPNYSCTSFQDAIDQAKVEIWVFGPCFTPFWWRLWGSNLLAAASRKVKVNLLVNTPVTEDERKYAALVIQSLTAAGCHVNLATGFPGFMALVDQGHFTWGHLTGSPGDLNISSGLSSALLPAAGNELCRLLQLELILQHLGRRGGGLKTCTQCGWPQVLINSTASRGFSDDQPLKIGCLGKCRDRKDSRDLGQREPFLIPPKCGHDLRTQYRQEDSGRHKNWVCPQHHVDPKCPVYRVMPGDPPDPYEMDDLY